MDKAEAVSAGCAWARLSQDRATLSRVSGSTAHLVAPDPATSPFWGAAPVCPTLTVHSEQTSDFCRLGAEQPHTSVPGKIQPAERTAGWMGVFPGPAAVAGSQSRSPGTAPSRAGLSAERRRCRRDAEMLLVVRRAEHGRDLLDGGRDLLSRS
jgi:hypothetical protein